MHAPYTGIHISVFDADFMSHGYSINGVILIVRAPPHTLYTGIHISVFDADFMSHDDFMGEVVIDPKLYLQLPLHHQDRRWFPLQGLENINKEQKSTEDKRGRETMGKLRTQRLLSEA